MYKRAIAFCWLLMVLGRTVTRQRIPASLVVLALFIGSSLRWFTMMATSTTAAAAVEGFLTNLKERLES